MESSVWVILLVLVTVVAVTGLRIANEDERFIVTTLGKFKAIIGPGLMMRMPFTQDKWKRIKVGDLGTFIGDAQVRFGDTVAPTTETDFTPHTSVVITSFRDGKIWVSETSSRIVICEKCGHENHVGA
jgi:hypothetical protein